MQDGKVNKLERVYLVQNIHLHKHNGCVIVWWGDAMTMSEARKRANKKWLDEHGHRYERLNLNLPTGTADKIKEQAKRRGYTSTSKYIVDLIDKDMQKDED